MWPFFEIHIGALRHAAAGASSVLRADLLVRRSGSGFVSKRMGENQGRRPHVQRPDGFTIERIAGPPLVDRPIVADFDEQGRLYVADSSGSNDNVQEAAREEAAPDRPPRGHRRRRRVRHAGPSSPTR